MNTMKLNYEALRQVMLTVQDKSLNPNPIEIVNDVTEKGFTQSDASYALKQAIDSRLIDGKAEADLSGMLYFVVQDITPDGHKFIDSISAEEPWAKVKQVLKEEGIPTTIPSISRTIAKLFF